MANPWQKYIIFHGKLTSRWKCTDSLFNNLKISNNYPAAKRMFDKSALLGVSVCQTIKPLKNSESRKDMRIKQDMLKKNSNQKF
jgi:hypothetical protein